MTTRWKYWEKKFEKIANKYADFIYTVVTLQHCIQNVEQVLNEAHNSLFFSSSLVCDIYLKCRKFKRHLILNIVVIL